MKSPIKKIAVLTSGGDAPGMNAAIRAVVRATNFYKLNCLGIYQGYTGLINGEFELLNARSVKNILQRGGTFLKSSRSKEFRTPKGRKAAYANLINQQVDALVTIGGDGTFTGAQIFSNEFDFPVMGVPGTIDNDLYGTDFTLGFDSATNVVIDCVDKIRDTAESHNRLFFVEVMGRDTGFIALRSGLASGAIDVILPEENKPISELINALETSLGHQKTNKIVMVAEGNPLGNTHEIAQAIRQHFPQFDAKVTILGHLQRGGAPSCLDRVLASQLGVAAVEGLLAGKNKVMVGIQKNEIVFTPLAKAISQKSVLNPNLLRVSKILAT